MRHPLRLLLGVLLALQLADGAVPHYLSYPERGSQADIKEQNAYLDSIRGKTYNRGKRPLYGVKYNNDQDRGELRSQGITHKRHARGNLRGSSYHNYDAGRVTRSKYYDGHH